MDKNKEEIRTVEEITEELVERSEIPIETVDVVDEEKMTKVEGEYGADEIQVLEGLEAVRKRPGMYIGSTGERGLHHLVYEIVDNSIDEALAGYCDKIDVSILPGNVIRVKDDGRGIPVGINSKMGLPAVTVVFTVLHAGGKFGGGGYKVSGGLHGVGASVVNALSEWLEVRVCDGKDIYFQRYERGKIMNDLEVIGQSTQRGTEVRFKADPEIFKDTDVYDYDTLARRLREQAFLNAGVNIELKDERDPEHIKDKTFYYKGGIKEFVNYIHKKKGYTPIHDEVIYLRTANMENTCEVEIAMQYNDSYNSDIRSFANNIHTTDGGTHEEGFRRAIPRVMNNYATKFNKIKEKDKDLKLEFEDYKEGMTAIISVKITEAQFEGQTKAKLGNTIVRSMVSKLITDKLSEFLEENPASASAIIDKALASAKAREAARKARENVRRKTGSAKQGRDRKFQAILPLWGKMLNVEKARLDKVYGNDKLTPVITALGAGIGDEFDTEKLRYDKIIIMADADVDGSHIRTLLLTFFFRYMRPLIEQGHVYIAQPPLYRISKGKDTHYYAYTDQERDELLAKIEGKTTIQRYKGLGEMDPEQLWETTMNPETRTMLRVELNDAQEADETFSILMGDQVEPRREFIETNAKYVQNLDI